MPHYEIHASTPLSSSQRGTFASRLTALHCITFTAPSIFVNITFHNDSTISYVGGKRQETHNYIIGHIRPRPASARHKVQELVTGIMALWDELVRSEDNKASGRLDNEKGLHNVFIMEDITAGAEQGFLLPIAGQDGSWVEENMAAFEKRAEDGDASMQAFLHEIKLGVGKGPL
ncbi:hypothetical protein ACN47E_009982 [Coniothyrium glycines]